MKHPPPAISHLVAIVILTLTSAASLADFTAFAMRAAATPTAERMSIRVLDGRLGGTRESFAAEYGDPVVETVESGSRYDVAGFGLVLVHYRVLEDELRPEDIAAVITLRAPRAEETPATAPHDRDWSIAQARGVVARFLPSDSHVDESTTDGEDTSQRLTATCRSEMLAEVYPSDPKPGTCQVGFLTPTPTTVSYVTLGLSAGGGQRVPRLIRVPRW